MTDGEALLSSSVVQTPEVTQTRTTARYNALIEIAGGIISLGHVYYLMKYGIYLSDERLFAFVGLMGASAIVSVIAANRRRDIMRNIN